MHMHLFAGDTGTVPVHAHDRGVDHLHRCVMSSGDGVHNVVPDARPAPTDEAIVTGGMRAEALRQIAPRRT